MEPRRNLLTLLVLLPVLSGVVACQSEPPPAAEETSQPREQSLGDFHLVETTGPDEVWHLRAPGATKTGEEIHLRNPRIVYLRGGDTVGRITAEDGFYSLSDQSLRLEGEVELVRIPQNQRLRTDVLYWDRAAGTIDTDAPVTLTTPRAVLRARGMHADLSKERLRFKSSVEYSSR